MKPLALRIVLWFFARVCYRLTVLGSDNVPTKGGALLVSNHISFVDMLLILASLRRFVRFLLRRTGSITHRLFKWKGRYPLY